MVAGYDPGRCDPGRFTSATELALRSFQATRGLPTDGVCDDATWQALVEASYMLGSRMLYHRIPMQRGDDVAELQRRLGALGFDAGRVDGIYGPSTAAAVSDFQRNCGLPPDGMCGHDTVLLLQRVGVRHDAAKGVAAVRESEFVLHEARSIAGCRVATGQTGGLQSIVRSIARPIRRKGATVVVLDDPDWSAQAKAANAYAADVYLGFTVDEGPVSITYYSTNGYESVGGRRLAELVAGEVSRYWQPVDTVGMRLPILRETRMPAILFNLGDVVRAARVVPRLAATLSHTLDQWLSVAVES